MESITKQNGILLDTKKIITRENVGSLTDDEFNELFPIVHANELNYYDDFFAYITDYKGPQLGVYLMTKLIDIAIGFKPKNFRVPKFLPTYDSTLQSISFGNHTNLSILAFKPEEWEKLSKEFMPNKNSRMGTLYQFSLFIGYVAQKLIEDETNFMPKLLKKDRAIKAWEEAIKLACGKNAKILEWDFLKAGKLVRRNESDDYPLLDSNRKNIFESGYRMINDLGSHSINSELILSGSLKLNVLPWVILDE